MELHTTLLGGQAFNWDYIDNKYYGFTQNGVIKISPDHEISQYNEDIDMDIYLGKHINLEKVKNEIIKDTHIQKAIENIKEVTILKQEFVQTTLSYIIATNKNIPSIRNSIRALGKKYGKKTVVDSITLYTFPTLERVANTSIEELKETKIGYRAEYIKRSSQILLKDDLQSSIDTLNKEEVRKKLIELPGVGPKVADCILLYPLGYLDTVPIDTWMYSIAKDIYKVPFTKYEDISKWYTNYFGKYAGIAGQYLFEYYRKLA